MRSWSLSPPNRRRFKPSLFLGIDVFGLLEDRISTPSAGSFGVRRRSASVDTAFEPDRRVKPTGSFPPTCPFAHLLISVLVYEKTPPLDFTKNGVFY